MVILICSILFAITSAIEDGIDLTHEFEINSGCVFGSSATIRLPGVTFNGKGGIVNQCGNWGFNARSGDEFFGINTFAGYPTGPFGATFDNCCTGGVQLFTAARHGNTFTMKGWDANDQLVDTVTVTTSAATWTPITITGIVKRVEVSSGNVWAVDDMTCYHQSDDCSTGCNSNALENPCSIDDDCPGCMRCCLGRGVCEYRPDFNVQAAKSVFFSFDNNDLHLPEPLINIKPAVHVKDPIYSYISLIGLIAFIIINNIFIGFWCLSKKNTVQYAKCDVVVDE